MIDPENYELLRVQAEFHIEPNKLEEYKEILTILGAAAISYTDAQPSELNSSPYEDQLEQDEFPESDFLDVPIEEDIDDRDLYLLQQLLSNLEKDGVFPTPLVTFSKGISFFGLEPVITRDSANQALVDSPDGDEKYIGAATRMFNTLYRYTDDERIGPYIYPGDQTENINRQREVYLRPDTLDSLKDAILSDTGYVRGWGRKSTEALEAMSEILHRHYLEDLKFGSDIQ